MSIDLITKYNAEEIGTRLLAVIEGKKVFIADKVNGQWVPNEVLAMIEGQLPDMPVENAPEAEAEGAPRRRGRPPKAVE